MVMFTGGEDISPSYYNNVSPKGMCHNNIYRDDEEQELFKLALDHEIKMIGICRGSQFLNVMAGGKMIHDVNNHAGVRHDIDTINNGTIQVNSLHHQMVIPPSDASIIGWSSKHQGTTYYGDYDREIEPPDIEPEVVLYENIKPPGAHYIQERRVIITDGYKFFYELARALLTIDDFHDIVKMYTEKPCQKKYCMQAGL